MSRLNRLALEALRLAATVGFVGLVITLLAVAAPERFPQ